MRRILTESEYKNVLEIKPELRIRETSGDPLYDRIVGILIGYSRIYDMRDGWIDIITTRDAEKEIKQLILDCGGSLKIKNN